MGTLREEFGLMEYSEEFIYKILYYRMYKVGEMKRDLSYEEIAEKENCSAEDVRKILSRTMLVWNH